MTLQEIKLLHAFNAWADNRIFDALAQLPEEQYRRDLKSSHGSIHGTVAHMVAAQKIWLDRWTGTPAATLTPAAGLANLEAVKALWQKVGLGLAQLLGTMSDKKLTETFTMVREGKTFNQVYWQAMVHVVDHSSYHRGQIVTMLRQLGVKPPSTGMIMFYRETAKL